MISSESSSVVLSSIATVTGLFGSNRIAAHRTLSVGRPTARAILAHTRSDSAVLSPKAAVLGCRLDIVVVLAQGLPVALIPHEPLIAFVWLDVVDHACCCGPILLKAMEAQRVVIQEQAACLLPSVPIATLR